MLKDTTKLAREFTDAFGAGDFEEAIISEHHTQCVNTLGAPKLGVALFLRRGKPHCHVIGFSSPSPLLA